MSMSPLRHIAALIAAMFILQLATGLLTVHLPLSMQADGMRDFGIGLVASAYSAAFMMGAWYGPRLLARVGHIRAYSAAASICAAAVLFASWADHMAAWVLLRAATGATIALMFAGVESWMSGSIRSEERGSVLGLYMVVTKAAFALGPFLGAAAPASGALVLAGALIALSITPIALTHQEAPALPEPEPPTYAELMATAPAAVVAAFAAGIVNAGVLAVAPLYAAAHWGPGAVAAFIGAATLGSLVLQWPAAKLSDRIDRRLVIAGLCVLAGATALVLAAVGASLPLWSAAVLFALWGAGALSFYGLAVAHMADRAAPAALTRCTSGLLFVWAAGAVVGPPMMGMASEFGGGAGLFVLAALGSFGCFGYMMMRRRIKEAGPKRKSDPAPDQATSVAAADLVYGDNDEAPGNQARQAPQKP